LQNAERHRLSEAQPHLGDGDRQRCRAPRTVAEPVGAAQKHDQRRGRGADEVAGVDDRPAPQERARGDPSARPGHDDEVVAGEELGAADHHEDQAEAEGESGQHARRTPRRRAGAGQRGRREDAAQRDEGAREHREREKARGRRRDLARAGLLRPPGHRGRQEGLEP
jgi:hypothetical protein